MSFNLSRRLLSRPGLLSRKIRRCDFLFLVTSVASSFSFLLWLLVVVSSSHDFNSSLLHNNQPRTDESLTRFLDLSLNDSIGQITILDVHMIFDRQGSLKLNESKLENAISTYRVGSFLNSPYSAGRFNDKSGFTTQEWISYINKLQNYSLREARLPVRVPLLYGIDSVHGAGYVYGATIFPHNLGLAATWNLDLVHKVAAVSARDTRNAGLFWSFSPVLDIGIHPLWPRFYETFGEDPYLVSKMGEAMLRGCNSIEYQEGLPSSILCTAKHFIGYSAPLSGKDRTDAWLSEGILRRYFLPPFKAAVEAGVKAIMLNSGSINGVPIHSSKQLIRGLLRDELKFTGVVVSDWSDVSFLHSRHRVAASYTEAIQMAIEAGVDMVMVPAEYNFSQLLYGLATANQTIASLVVEAADRVLKVKKGLGLLEPNPAQPGRFLYESIESPEELDSIYIQDRKFSADVVRESITLLKNDNVLPLSTTAETVMVTGPAGDSLSLQSGPWSIHWQGTVDEEFSAYGKTSTIYEGIKGLLNANSQTVYIEGCGFTECKNLDELSTEIKKSSVKYVIAAIGELVFAETEGNVDDLTLSSSQLNLLRNLSEIKRIDNPSLQIILVLIQGRPRLLPPDVVKDASAILLCYLPGPYGGEAIADVLFGRVNPSGRLPFSYPAATGDIPVPYFKRVTESTLPLFPFGFGLSFTTFSYSDLTLSTTSMRRGELLGVSVKVTNSGLRAGKEVVQLYIKDLYASVIPEVKMLRKFYKTKELKAGETVTVEFVLKPEEDMTIIGRDNKEIIEDGEFEVSVADLSVSFSLGLDRLLQ